jgi:hypothetical protein
MKTQHTPAPWYHVDGFSGDYIMTSEDPRKGNYIASLRANDGSLFEGITSKQLQANARLIAAAPELLETLMVILNHITQSNVDFNYKGVIVPKNDILKYIEQAIQKATHP